MSDHCIVTLKDGTVREFQDRGRPGGSYSMSVYAEGEFLVIKDAWDKRTYIPAADIKDVETTEKSRW